MHNILLILSSPTQIAFDYSDASGVALGMVQLYKQKESAANRQHFLRHFW